MLGTDIRRTRQSCSPGPVGVSAGGRRETGQETGLRGVERELALVKVKGDGENRVEALRIADIFGADVVDAGLDYFVFQMSHRSDKLDRFVDLMKPLGLVDLCRTGVVAMTRGSEGL